MNHQCIQMITIRCHIPRGQPNSKKGGHTEGVTPINSNRHISKLDVVNGVYDRYFSKNYISKVGRGNCLLIQQLSYITLGR